MLAFLLIAEHFVGLLDVDELAGTGGIFGYIRMMLLGQLVVLALDFLLGGIRLKAERVVVGEGEAECPEEGIEERFLS